MWTECAILTPTRPNSNVFPLNHSADVERSNSNMLCDRRAHNSIPLLPFKCSPTSIKGFLKPPLHSRIVPPSNSAKVPPSKRLLPLCLANRRRRLFCPLSTIKWSLWGNRTGIDSYFWWKIIIGNLCSVLDLCKDTLRKAEVQALWFFGFIIRGLVEDDLI